MSLSAGNVHSNFVPGNLRPVAEALGVREENGYYDLAQILEAIVDRLPDGESARAPMELLPGDPIRQNARGKLMFRSALGGNVEYRIVVVYLTTQACATAAELRRPRSGNGSNTISWEWDCGTAEVGDAIAIVTATLVGVVVARQFFEFSVVESNPRS